jgi:hypothetical protein
MSPKGYVKELEMTLSDVEMADRLSRQRARMIPVLVIIFLAGQAAYFSQGGAERAVDQVKIAAWLVWAIVLLLLLATGGGFIQRKEVRALLNDETTRANRLQAYSIGFWSGVGCAVGLYFLTMFEPLSAREAIHIVVTAAIAGALLTFGLLERRSHRDG